MASTTKNNFLTNIDETIQKVLEIRQSEQSRTTLSWFRNRTPWARAASLVSIDGKDDKRKEFILFSGTQELIDNKLSLKEFYDPADFNRPHPGITKVDVKNKGTFGSVREAVISFNCWTLEQLDIMEKLYMSLGMPVLLEWGWNMLLDGTPVDDTLYLQDPREFSLKCLDRKIKRLVNLYQGHYDGMIGLVTDFNWTLREDGGFDCSVTLISQGEMYLAMNTKTTSKQIKKNPSALQSVAANENLESYLFNLRSILKGGEPIKEVGLHLSINGVSDRPDLNEDSKVPEDLTQYFLTWGAIEKILERNVGYTYSDSNTKEDCGEYAGAPLAPTDNSNEETSVYGEENNNQSNGISLLVPGLQPGQPVEATSAPTITAANSWSSSIVASTGGNTISQQSEKEKAAGEARLLSKTGTFSKTPPIFPIINNSDLKINYIYGVRSINPNICILPINDTTIMIDDGSGTSAITEPLKLNDSGIKDLSNFMMTIQDKDNFPNVKILLKEVLVNLNFFYEKYKTTENLADLLYALLNGISDACGNLWKFQIMIDEDNTPEIRILEEQSVSDNAFIKPSYFKEFKVYNKESAVRTVNFSTNVTSDVKNKILLDSMNSNKEKAPKDHSQVGFIHYYDAKVKSLLKENNMRGVNPGEGSKGKLQTLETENTVDVNKQLYQQLIDAYKKIRDDGFSASIIEEALPVLKSYLAKLTVSKKGDKEIYFSHKNFMTLPLTLSLTIDGIAGLKWGNKIKIDYIPDRYKNNSAFALVNIVHSITPDDWTCVLESMFRTLNDPNEVELTPTEPISEELKKEEVVQKLIVILDSAHGIETPGKRSPDGSHFEYKWSRETIGKVERLLEVKGYDVYKTNTKDADVNGKLRKDIAEKVKDRPKLLISLHNNGAGNGIDWSTATGSEVWFDSRRQKDKVYADKMYEILKSRFLDIKFRPGSLGNAKQFGTSPDDTRNLSLSYYQGNTYYTVIIEWLFQDSRKDVAKLKDPEVNFKLAQAIVESVEEINKMM